MLISRLGSNPNILSLINIWKPFEPEKYNCISDLSILNVSHSFLYTIFKSISNLADYLIVNVEDFSHKRKATIIQGISRALKQNKTYCGYHFDYSS